MSYYQEFLEKLNAFEYGLKSGIYHESTFDPDYSFDKQISRAQILIRQAIIFEVDDTIKLACALHKAPKLRYDFLPHKTMFLDVDFKLEEFDILKKKNVRRLTGIILLKSPLMNDKVRDEQVGEAINAITVCERDGMVWLDSMTFNQKITNPIFKKAKKTFKKIPENKFIENFIYNMLNFINDPETKLINVDRSAKNAMRRAKQGKPLIPSSIQVKLTGSTKIYVDEFHKKIKSGDAKWHYNYRFPVRSHVRKYRDRQGNVIKEVEVSEYIKGRGILVDKRYKVE